jgi:hypothetical protein
MEKVGALFADLSGKLRAAYPFDGGTFFNVEGVLPAGFLTEGLPLNWATPKISKGENYKGLPYMVLDYPRAFGREDVFAIRTFFWWGHYFSVTLHLKGRYETLFFTVIREHIALLADAGFHINVSEDEWRHELDSDNYIPLQECTDTVLQKERKFLKLSARLSLDRWNEADIVLLELFRVLMGVLLAAS